MNVDNKKNIDFSLINYSKNENNSSINRDFKSARSINKYLYVPASLSKKSKTPIISKDSPFEITSHNAKNIFNKKPNFTVIVDTEEIKNNLEKDIQNFKKCDNFIKHLKRELFSKEEIDLISNKKINIISIEKNKLDFIANNEKIYIAGHGKAGHKGIYVKDDEKYSFCSTDDIADTLSKSGLSKSHISFRLLACFSADNEKLESVNPSKYDSISEPVEKEFTNKKGEKITKIVKPAAHHLAESLSKKGFSNPEVTGYHGMSQRLPVKGKEGLYHSAVMGDDDYDSKRRSEHKEIFNSSGRLTSATASATTQSNSTLSQSPSTSGYIPANTNNHKVCPHQDSDSATSAEQIATTSGAHSKAEITDTAAHQNTTAAISNKTNTSSASASSATESGLSPRTSNAAMANSVGTAAHQNPAAISNATAHAAVASSSSGRESDNPFKPLAEDKSSQPVSTEEESQKEKAEKAIKNIAKNDTHNCLTDSTTLEQRIEPEKIIKNAGTELPTESLEPHQSVAQSDVSEAIPLHSRLQALKKGGVRTHVDYPNHLSKIMFEISHNSEDFKRMCYDKDFVKECVLVAKVPLHGSVSNDRRLYYAPFNSACYVASHLAQSGELPAQGYEVWLAQGEQYNTSPTALIQQHLGKKNLETLSFLTIAANAPFQSLELGFDHYESFSKHFLKPFKKSQWSFITNTKELKKANELLNAASSMRSSSNDLPVIIPVENMLSDVKSAIEENIQFGEKLIENYKDLGQTVGASGPSQVEQDKKTERKAEQDALIELGLNNYAANETRAISERKDKNQNYHNHQNAIARYHQASDNNKARKMQADASRMMIENAVLENKITIENKAKNNQLQQERQKHGQLGQTPAQPAITQPEQHPSNDAYKLRGPLKKTLAPNEASPSQSHSESVAENDSALNTQSSMQVISSLPGAQVSNSEEGDKTMSLNANLIVTPETQIFGKKEYSEPAIANIDVTVKLGKTKTVYYAHNAAPIESTPSATGPQLATLSSLNKSVKGIVMEMKGADGSEIKTAWPWKAFDNFNYTSPQNSIISITTGEIPNGNKPQALPKSFSEASVKENTSFNSEDHIEKSRIEKKQQQWPEAQKSFAKLYQENETHRDKEKREKQRADAENQRKKKEESRESHKKRDFLHKAAESHMVQNNPENQRKTELKKSSNKK